MNLDARVTAAEASRLLPVSRQLIAMWRSAGKVVVRGKRGASPLYRLGDLIKVEHETRQTRKSSRYVERPSMESRAA
jgi:hypothetical protein